ncbi:major facilitator superfamily transporter [Microsporum canis CBS 113480]|uniref:Major facilitator superfamily transporter n=1 Tax=Arthroderma otae (strain ATCC MYA-4605 / CBS 113480) TaxID=554155 RepID=C5FQT3_ARTOC|nr:major facilitator superfamily transporter [Microsporum canis CBS 113480]EEQ32236.1 major facilitator superfamily transporter [Microsporum canis CBS 113480]
MYELKPRRAFPTLDGTRCSWRDKGFEVTDSSQRLMPIPSTKGHDGNRHTAITAHRAPAGLNCLFRMHCASPPGFGTCTASRDTTIVSTAIPAISEEFKTTQDVGWYGSAYFLTMCAFQISWGRVYTFYDLKTTYIVAIVIFEVGSLLCAVAPTSTTFIVGRAFAGLGAGGVFSGSFVTIAFSVPLAKRPLYASCLGTVYGVASILGPPIGGVFTSRLSWRGCFYMNLPLGAIVIAGLIPFFKSPQTSARLASLAPKEKLKRLDLAALQWGGQTYSWSDGRIIALLVLFGVTFIGWIAWQAHLGPVATIPRTIIRQRSMLFASFYSFTQGGVNFGILYYVPLWFQAVKGHDAVRSGLDIVTFIAGMTVTMMITGYILTKGGYSAPFMVLCVIVVSVACGLLTTWTPNSGVAKIFGYLTLYGLGQGFGWQQPILIAQTVLPAARYSHRNVAHNRMQASRRQSLFNNKLRGLVIQRLPQLDPDDLMTSGAIELRSRLDASLIPKAASCYNDALRRLVLMLALSTASLVAALGIDGEA